MKFLNNYLIKDLTSIILKYNYEFKKVSNDLNLLFNYIYKNTIIKSPYRLEKIITIANKLTEHYLVDEYYTENDKKMVHIIVTLKSFNMSNNKIYSNFCTTNGLIIKQAIHQDHSN